MVTGYEVGYYAAVDRIALQLKRIADALDKPAEPPQVKLTSLIEEARSLASEDGENPEYDRALVELVCAFMDGGRDSNNERVEALLHIKRGQTFTRI